MALKKFIFPVAVMANNFSMMVAVIAFSIAGESVLAAEFALTHATTLAIFFSLSGNARSLILRDQDGSSVADILRLRLTLVIPLAIAAAALTASVVDSAWWLILLWVTRRAAEWIAEVTLGDLERHTQSPAAAIFIIAQSCTTLLMMLSWILWHPFILPATIAWALAPLITSVSVHEIRRLWARGQPAFNSFRRMLPHFGSTAIIGISVYIFRLFVTALVGKEGAGDLFAAFAVGGVLGTVFTQAIGPTVVNIELNSKRAARILHAMWAVVGLTALSAVLLLSFITWAPGALEWTRKSAFFWQAVGYSLLGAAITVVAQRVRLHILQRSDEHDVFGSDVLANIALIASIPLVYLAAGGYGLTTLSFLAAVIALVFYCTERQGLYATLMRGGKIAKMHAFILLVCMLLPVFFQLNGGLFDSKDIVYDSLGKLSQVPLPISIVACCLGIIVLGGYSGVRRSLMMFFILFLGLCLGAIFAGELGSERITLLMQFLLPFSALIFGEQFGQQDKALEKISEACKLVLWLIVPLQLLNTWQLGFGYLSPSIYVFSIYQHLQYAPVLFVAMYWIMVFEQSSRGGIQTSSMVLGVLMAVYVVQSQSVSAILLMGLALLSYIVEHSKWTWRQSVAVLIVLVAAGWVSVQYLTGWSSLPEKFTGYQGGLLPRNMVERLGYWDFYFQSIMNSHGALLFGNVAVGDRVSYPSAHNYYLDLLYNFGLVAILPVAGLLLWTLASVLKNLRAIWGNPALFGMVLITLFIVFVDNSFKVGMRQPYSGILTFFFWGVVLARLPSLSPSKNAQA